MQLGDCIELIVNQDVKMSINQEIITETLLSSLNTSTIVEILDNQTNGLLFAVSNIPVSLAIFNSFYTFNNMIYKKYWSSKVQIKTFSFSLYTKEIF